MPWPRLNTCPGPRPKLSSTRRVSARSVSGGANSADGSRLPCSATRPPTAARGPRTDPWSSPRPTASQPIAAICREPRAAALGEHDVRHAAAVAPRASAHRRSAPCSAARTRAYCAGVSTPPQVSNSITACAPAAICALRYRMVARASTSSSRCSSRGASYIMRLMQPEALAAAALDHVGAHRPGAAGEADQRHAAARVRGGSAPRRRSRTCSSRRGSGTPEPVDVGGRAHRALELRALARLELQAQIHGVRDGQDVGEQDRGVERIAVDGLQRDLAGELADWCTSPGSCRRAPGWRGTRAGSGPPGASARSGRRGVGSRSSARSSRSFFKGAFMFARSGRTAAGVPGWRSGRSCRRCSRRRRARGRPVPAPTPGARRSPVLLGHQAGIVEKGVEQRASRRGRALAVMRRTL